MSTLLFFASFVYYNIVVFVYHSLYGEIKLSKGTGGMQPFAPEVGTAKFPQCKNKF